MGYDKKHTEEQCDKCLKNVGKENLRKVPFLYCDKNDRVHEDVSYLIGLPKGEGYRQYYICKDCKP